MIFKDLDQTGIVYVVKSKKNGNEITVQLPTLDEVASYVEQESDIIGVWNITVVKLPPGVYTRRHKK